MYNNKNFLYSFSNSDNDFDDENENSEIEIDENEMDEEVEKILSGIEDDEDEEEHQLDQEFHLDNNANEFNSSDDSYNDNELDDDEVEEILASNKEDLKPKKEKDDDDDFITNQNELTSVVDNFESTTNEYELDSDEAEEIINKNKIELQKQNKKTEQFDNDHYNESDSEEDYSNEYDLDVDDIHEEYNIEDDQDINYDDYKFSNEYDNDENNVSQEEQINFNDEDSDDYESQETKIEFPINQESFDEIKNEEQNLDKKEYFNKKPNTKTIVKNNENGFKNNNFENKEQQKNVVSIVPPEEAVNYNYNNEFIIDNKNTNQKDSTYIFALGGLDEIGKNTYVIEHNEETIVVDSGIKFASSDMLGFNGIIPNFDYFKENNQKINYLFITHGHEDHIGGIPYLLQEVEVEKIYAPLLAAELIKRRLSEFKEIKVPEILTFSDDTIVNSKYFNIDFFRVCHSIPDCFGLCIQTPNGNIVSAGDYRFDFGKYTDDTNIHKIVEMSNRNVDVFLAESTNSDSPGFSETEDNIIKNIEYLIKISTGRVFVATFASNLGRIETIIEKAINLNRKICIMGRSMEANIKTSRKVGYLKLNDTDLISSKEIQSTPDNEVLVVLTGSQGEEMAALNLMAEGRYQKVPLKPQDTIILSSNPIPGNFKSVELLVNKLFKLGVNVIQHSPNYKIHASGHATKQEQQMMMKLVNAKYVVPIHGESKMLKSMKNNAIDIGYDPENIFILRNGQKIELKNHVLTPTKQCIDASAILIDKKLTSKKTLKLIEDRRWLSEDGVFNVIILKDKTNNVLCLNPMINTRGCFYAKQSAPLIAKMSYSIKDEIEKQLKSNPSITDNEITDIVRKTIHFFIWKNKKKRPVVLTTIFER
ncbi:RNase J family beta-CASP ribonuclease [Malacoplasma iowae]|uniref:RNase J family beta-CASP ribonuclease n=1 Tax=Malacoplasma iowae TaxID=2116 RepID=UPI002A1886FC|nr:RNase J family beta-CASP ribonuclease [Malacoplasma iowae]WPL39768.1 RNase J family beta-CASP ribonuclease [Malacoplasma iowae]